MDNLDIKREDVIDISDEEDISDVKREEIKSEYILSEDIKDVEILEVIPVKAEKKESVCTRGNFETIFLPEMYAGVAVETPFFDIISYKRKYGHLTEDDEINKPDGYMNTNGIRNIAHPNINKQEEDDPIKCPDVSNSYIPIVNMNSYVDNQMRINTNIAHPNINKQKKDDPIKCPDVPNSCIPIVNMNSYVDNRMRINNNYARNYEYNNHMPPKNNLLVNLNGNNTDIDMVTGNNVHIMYQNNFIQPGQINHGNEYNCLNSMRDNIYQHKNIINNYMRTSHTHHGNEYNCFNSMQNNIYQHKNNFMRANQINHENEYNYLNSIQNNTYQHKNLMNNFMPARQISHGNDYNCLNSMQNNIYGHKNINNFMRQTQINLGEEYNYSNSMQSNVYQCKTRKNVTHQYKNLRQDSTKKKKNKFNSINPDDSFPVNNKFQQEERIQGKEECDQNRNICGSENKSTHTAKNVKLKKFKCTSTNNLIEKSNLKNKDNPNEGRYKCPICKRDKMFDTLLAVNNHLKFAHISFFSNRCGKLKEREFVVIERDLNFSVDSSVESISLVKE